jgi:hypothetical protein
MVVRGARGPCHDCRRQAMQQEGPDWWFDQLNHSNEGPRSAASSKRPPQSSGSTVTSVYRVTESPLPPNRPGAGLMNDVEAALFLLFSLSVASFPAHHGMTSTSRPHVCFIAWKFSLQRRGGLVRRGEVLSKGRCNRRCPSFLPGAKFTPRDTNTSDPGRNDHYPLPVDEEEDQEEDKQRFPINTRDPDTRLN